MESMGFAPTDLCEDLVCCVICFEPFNNEKMPKALPCLHTFCVECLKGSIKSHQQAVNKHPKAVPPSSFPCPMCKEVTKIPSNGIDGFKDDFRIQKISEVLAIAKPFGRTPSSSTAKLKVRVVGAIQQCEVCKFFKKESTADLYCLECNKLLCKSCSEKHLNTRLAKNHNIVDAAEAAPSDTVCSVHAPEVVKYFCRDCARSVCATCTFTDEHANHSVVNLDEESKSAKLELSSLVATCRNKHPQINEALAEYARLEEKLQKREKVAHKAILMRTIEEIGRIRKDQQKMEHELETLCRNKTQEIQDSRGKLHQHSGEMKEFCDLTDTIIKSGQDFQVVSGISEMRSRLKNMAAFKAPEPPEEATFVELGKYDELAEQFDGNMISEEALARDNILSEVKSVASQMKLFSVGRAEMNVDLIKTVGKKGNKDGEFNFPSGVAIFENGDIAVADLHNSRVQIFDKDGTYKSKFGHDGFKPCGIAVTKENDIAVTDTKNHVNCVKVFSVDGTRKASFGYGEFDYPFCLAIDSKGRFVVSDPAKNEIVTLESDGNIYKRFATRTKFAFYLSVNSKDQIVVSDWYHHCIRIFDQNGLLLKKMGSRGFDEGQLMIPLGITTDGRSTILVLDCKCQRISMFGSDGRFIKHILQGKDMGIEYSRAIALSRNGRLVISHGDNKRDVPNDIRIYQI